MIISVQTDAKETTSTLGFDDKAKKVDIIRKYIRKRGEVNRRSMQMSLSSRGVLRDDLDRAIRELQSTGEVKIILDDRVKRYPSQNGEEIYKWRK